MREFMMFECVSVFVWGGEGVTERRERRWLWCGVLCCACGRCVCGVMCVCGVCDVIVSDCVCVCSCVHVCVLTC